MVGGGKQCRCILCLEPSFSGSVVLGMTKRELLMQPRYAKITTLEIDTCLTWRGMNSPALAALDDASKMPFKAPFQ